MDILRINGKKRLEGTVRSSGARNVITKLLVASLLSDKKCTFYNVPNVEDVAITLETCKELGMEASWDKEGGIIETITKELKTTYIPHRFSGSNRIPILMIGALLSRTDEEIIVPIGPGEISEHKPINFHIDALRSLGAIVEHREMKKESAYFAYAPQGLKGSLITLPYPSIGATENTILAAVTARGVTTIKNAATEPEILDLVLFLQKLGSHIAIDADRTIRIQGTRHFYDVEHTVMADRIEAAYYGAAAIATQGHVFVENADHLALLPFLNKLRTIGGGFSVKRNGIEFFYEGPLQGVAHIETDAYPGFTTDWQPPFVAILTQTSGSSIVHETVYEHRFNYVENLQAMGADITLFKQCLGGTKCRFATSSYPHSIVVKGMTPLYGKEITIPDLRASLIYVVQALMAEGESRISNISFLERTFENVVEKFSALGADIERVPKA